MMLYDQHSSYGIHFFIYNTIRSGEPLQGLAVRKWLYTVLLITMFLRSTTLTLEISLDNKLIKETEFFLWLLTLVRRLPELCYLYLFIILTSFWARLFYKTPNDEGVHRWCSVQMVTLGSVGFLGLQTIVWFLAAVITYPIPTSIDANNTLYTHYNEPAHGKELTTIEEMKYELDSVLSLTFGASSLLTALSSFIYGRALSQSLSFVPLPLLTAEEEEEEEYSLRSSNSRMSNSTSRSTLSSQLYHLYASRRRMLRKLVDKLCLLSFVLLLIRGLLDLSIGIFEWSEYKAATTLQSTSLQSTSVHASIAPTQVVTSTTTQASIATITTNSSRMIGWLPVPRPFQTIGDASIYALLELLPALILLRLVGVSNQRNETGETSSTMREASFRYHSLKIQEEHHHSTSNSSRATTTTTNSVYKNTNLSSSSSEEDILSIRRARGPVSSSSSHQGLAHGSLDHYH